MKKSMVQKFLGLPFSARQAALGKTRNALGKSEFVNIISRSGGDTEATEIIYSKLQDWIYVEEFTAYPDDNLAEIFGIAEEELDEDIILDIINHLALPIPTQDLLNDFGSVETANDVARLVTLSRASGSKAR